MAKITLSATASHTKRSIGRQLALDILLTMLILAMIGCTALAFLVPWLPPLPAGGAALARYSPISDGDGWLGEQVTPATSAKVLRSENTRILAHERALTTELRQAAIDGLRKYVLKPGETNLDDNQLTSRISSMQVILEEDTTLAEGQNLAANSKVEKTTATILRTHSGDLQLAIYSPLQNSDLIFDPPVLLRPADFRPGAQWQTDGNLGSYKYHSNGSIAAETSYQGLPGHFNDCRKVSLRLSLEQQAKVIDDTTYVDWFCNGIGEVAEQELDANGKARTQTKLIASNRFSNPSGQPPAPALPVLNPSTLAEAMTTTDPANWVLDVLGRTRTASDTTESTIQPVWVPADPPFLLVAGHGGDLIALDITQSPGQVLWRYHPNGTIYGQPTIDATPQLIFFGDSGKQLVALDWHGQFRWSFTCGDNIVPRPVVDNDSLIFGSEDRNVYALDPLSGALRWKYTTSGAVVASPAEDGEIVMIGSDDGVVYAFKTVTGEKLWTFTTGQAIEAPLMAEDGVVYIASRDMSVYAVRAGDGSQIWQNDVGNILRTRPVLGKTAIYVIDENGHLTAIRKNDGRRLWTSVEHDYEGAPLLVDQTLLAAGSGGVIYRLTEDGKRLSAISGADASPTVEDIDYRLGLTLGGNAAWTVDTKGYIWRFGPIWSAAQPLELAWSATLTSPPFKASPFYSPGQLWRGQFIVLDQAGNLYKVDPATGKAAFIGSIKKDPGNFRIGMQIEGDVLLASSGNTLYAVTLPDIVPLWQFNAQAYGLAPAVVAGNRIAWVTNATNNQAMLNLIDLQTGKLAQAISLNGVSVSGNAIIQNGVVYVNSPVSAYQLDGGQKIWQAPAADSLGIGQAVLSPDGETLYSPLTDTHNLQNRVAAFATRDGSLRWTADLGADTVSVLGNLTLDGNTLVVPLNTGTRAILALDAGNGKELWRFIPDYPRLGNPSIDKGIIWFTLENGQVVAVDLNTGHEVGRLGLTQADLESYNFAQAISFTGEYALAPAGWSLLEIKIPTGLLR